MRTLAVLVALASVMVTSGGTHSGALVLLHAELHDGYGGVLRDAALVIEGDTIAEIRPDGTGKPGERVEDWSGRVLIPGLVDANSSLLAGHTFNYRREEPILPNLRVQDGIESRDRIHAGAAAPGTGLTVAYLSPGAWRPIGGQGVTLRLDGESLLDMIMPARPFVHFSINEGALLPAGRGENMPRTHLRLLALIRRSLREARQYAARRDGGETALFDPDLQTLAEVLSGERIARIDVDSTHEIRSAIALAREFGIQPILEHCVEAYKMRDALVEAGFPVVLLPYVQGDVYDLETERLMLETPAWLAARGVPVAFQTLGHGMPPYANLHEYNEPQNLLLAGILQVRSGMDPEEVLRAMTSTPAALLGISDHVGSLTAGKRANFVVLDGQPFEYTTRVQSVWMSGVRIFDRASQKVFVQ